MVAALRGYFALSRNLQSPRDAHDMKNALDPAKCHLWQVDAAFRRKASPTAPMYTPLKPLNNEAYEAVFPQHAYGWAHAQYVYLWRSASGDGPFRLLASSTNAFYDAKFSTAYTLTAAVKKVGIV